MSTGVIDTGTDHLLADLTGGILTLTFNRPEARNALSSELLQALGSQLADGEINPEVRCVVITGTGAAFCAGGDVKAMSETNSNGAKSTLDTLIQRQRLNQRATSGRLYKMPKPTSLWGRPKRANCISSPIESVQKRLRTWVSPIGWLSLKRCRKVRPT